jgi:hypothetical protein
MRTVFAVAGVLGHPSLRFLTLRHTILSDVVEVILAVATWLDASCQFGDQGICLSAVAIVLPPFADLGRPGDGLAGGVAAHAMATWRDPAAWEASRCKTGGTRSQQQARRSRSAWAR